MPQYRSKPQPARVFEYKGVFMDLFTFWDAGMRVQQSPYNSMATGTRVEIDRHGFVNVFEGMFIVEREDGKWDALMPARFAELYEEVPS